MAAVTADDTGGINEVVADKGYHSNQVLTDLAALDLRGYIAEPDRGRRNWTKNAVARDAVYAKRSPRLRVPFSRQPGGLSGTSSWSAPVVSINFSIPSPQPASSISSRMFVAT